MKIFNEKLSSNKKTFHSDFTVTITGENYSQLYMSMEKLHKKLHKKDLIHLTFEFSYNI